DGSKRGEVEVDSYTVEGTLVTLIVMSCDGDPKVDVAESDDEVRVSVISTTQKSGNGCQDPAQFELDNELGERPIIDEFNVAIITASNWTVRLYGSAEWLSCGVGWIVQLSGLTEGSADGANSLVQLPRSVGNPVVCRSLAP